MRARALLRLPCSIARSRSESTVWRWIPRSVHEQNGSFKGNRSHGRPLRGGKGNRPDHHESQRLKTLAGLHGRFAPLQTTRLTGGSVFSHKACIPGFTPFGEYTRLPIPLPALQLLLRSGSCARMMATNMSAQPIPSRADICSPSRIVPNTTEKTDSRHMIIEAIVGSVSFCATICSV